MTTSADRRGSESRSLSRAKARTSQKFIGKALRAPAGPDTPVVAGKLLTANAIGFLDFLSDAACRSFWDRRRAPNGRAGREDAECMPGKARVGLGNIRSSTRGFGRGQISCGPCGRH
jgi:hypothetical protein